MIQEHKEKLYSKLEKFADARERFMSGSGKGSVSAQEAVDWFDDIVDFVDQLIDDERRDARE